MPQLVDTDPNAASEDVHLQRLLATSVEEPWFKSLARNIQEAIRPPKLPPLELTSKPVAVKDIWGLYGRKRESGVMSLAIHGCVVLLMFTVLSNKTVQTKIKETVHLVAPDIAPYMPELAPKPKTMQGGGGGGDRSPTSRVRLCEGPPAKPTGCPVGSALLTAPKGCAGRVAGQTACIPALAGEDL